MRIIFLYNKRILLVGGYLYIIVEILVQVNYIVLSVYIALVHLCDISSSIILFEKR
jgi:hypothetical protein